MERAVRIDIASALVEDGRRCDLAEKFKLEFTGMRSGGETEEIVHSKPNLELKEPTPDSEPSV